MKLTLFKNRRGISIFIAIFFMAITSIIALGVNEVIVPFLKGTGNVEIMNQAYFAAEGGIEDALYDLSEHTSGYEHSIEQEFSARNKTDYKWQVISKLPEYSANVYRIPAVRLGNSPLDKEWNILQKHQSIVINLFVDASLPGSKTTAADIRNPDDLGISKLQIKLRAPEGKVLEINESAEETSIPDDTIMTWTIFGKSETLPDKEYSLREIASYDHSVAPPAREEGESTEIYESKINCVPNDMIIDSEELGIGKCLSVGQGINQDGNPESIIIDFLSQADLHKPSLKLSIISNLLDTTENILPYLEYQIYITANSSTPSQKTRVISIGEAAGFQQKLETTLATKAAESFVEFVVFQ